MANAATATAVKPAVGETDFEAPSNFEDVGQPDIEGWYKPEIAPKFMGKVVGRTQIPNDDGQMRDVVLIELEKPCKAIMEEKEVLLEPGQCMGVGIRAKLTELLYYVEKKGRVFAKVEGKRKLKGSRTMWLFTVKGEKGKRANPPAPVHRAGTGDTTGDVDF